MSAMCTGLAFELIQRSRWSVLFVRVIRLQVRCQLTDLHVRHCPHLLQRVPCRFPLHLILQRLHRGKEARKAHRWGQGSVERMALQFAIILNPKRLESKLALSDASKHLGSQARKSLMPIIPHIPHPRNILSIPNLPTPRSLNPKPPNSKKDPNRKCPMCRCSKTQTPQLSNAPTPSAPRPNAQNSTCTPNSKPANIPHPQLFSLRSPGPPLARLRTMPGQQCPHR